MQHSFTADAEIFSEYGLRLTQKSSTQHIFTTDS